MLRPNVRELLKELSPEEVISKVECFIQDNPAKEFWLANIDLLRLYGRTLNRAKFYEQALFLVNNINNVSVYRELARFYYFIEKNSNKAKFYSDKAISLNKGEPLWIYYISKRSFDYYEKIYDGVFLTAIPKNASTSLKTMVLEKLHNKTGVNPHSVFGNPFFSTSSYEEVELQKGVRLLSIREPIARFLSYYNKNIIEESSLSEELNYSTKVKEFGLDLKPSLPDFIDNLSLYCYVFNDVLHHILPQTAYFSNIDSYDCISDLKDSHKLGELVSTHLKLDEILTPPKKMVSANKIEKINISEQYKEIISRLFNDDIKMYNENVIDKDFSFKF